MLRSKPPLKRLCELQPGDTADFYALLAERAKGATREGKPFFSCRFRDAVKSLTLMVWSDSPWHETCEKEWREGRFYKIRGAFGVHDRYGPQIDLHNIRPVCEADHADGFNPNDLVEHTRFDGPAMFAELRALAEANIQDAPLQRLVLVLLDRHAPALQTLPATMRNFYPFAGGLLEHILSVTKSCLHLVEKYQTHYPELTPPLNRDLVAAGAILHDIGRVAEFTCAGAVVEATVPGRLLGHLFLGRDIVRDASRELGDVDPDLVQMLEHIIISHLNLPEWGSPRLPLMPECLIIHHADDLDAKMEMYVRCLTRDSEEGKFTARDPVLGRKLYKGRTV